MGPKNGSKMGLRFFMSIELTPWRLEGGGNDTFAKNHTTWLVGWWAGTDEEENRRDGMRRRNKIYGCRCESFEGGRKKSRVHMSRAVSIPQNQELLIPIPFAYMQEESN